MAAIKLRYNHLFERRDGIGFIFFTWMRTLIMAVRMVIYGHSLRGFIADLNA
jgi:hypothetical protein